MPPRDGTVQANSSLVLPDVDCTDAGRRLFGILVGDPEHGTSRSRPRHRRLHTDTRLCRAGLAHCSWRGRVRRPVRGRAAEPPVTAPPAAGADGRPAPPAAPKDLSAPTVALKNASKKQAVAIALTTNENASATLTLALDKATAKKLKLSRTVGTLKAALKPGTSTLKVKLSSKAAKAFKKLKPVKLTVTAVVADTAGNKTTKTLEVTLKK